MHSRYLVRCGTAAVAMALATSATAQTRDFDIPSQPLAAAIAALGRQARLQIVAPAEGLETIRSRPIKGAQDARAALRALIAGTGLVIASDSGGTIVLRRSGQPDTRADSDPVAASERLATTDQDIIVTGLRASLASAIEIKRKSDAIVDVVAAEDIGQLPDNSATEALARLPGVQVFRNRGEGQAITIRGISSVVTTINDQEAYTGASRRTLLNSYPAALIRSMEVYKALTPDLIEGGIGGSVNVQLRKPLDFKRGITIAGTVRGSYDDLADKFFYNGDLLVSGNWQTGIGEIGAMVNASFLRRDYYETYREALQPQANAAGRIPTGILAKNPKGYYERPVLTGELQWRPAYNFGLHLRATNVTDDNRYTDTDFQTNIAANTVMSNVVLVPATDVVKSATFTATANSGPRTNRTRELLDTTQVEFGADFTSGIATLTTNAVYTTSRIENDEQLMLLAFNQAPVIDAVFQGDGKYGGLSYSYPNVDLTDINQFHVRAYSDTRSRAKGKGLQWRTDLNLDTGNGLVRAFKTGFRFTKRSADYQTGTGLADLNALRLPLSSFPGGATPIVLARDTSRDDASIPAGWVGYDGGYLNNADNLAAMNGYVDSLLTTDLFTDNDRPAFNPLSAFEGNERTFAFYGQLKYDLDLGGVRVDGVAGARVVNTWLDIHGTQRTRTRTPTSGGIITVFEPIDRRQNYVDFNPSISAVVHFDPKLQLRLAWTKTFSRPDFSQLNPTLDLAQVTSTSAYVATAVTGNPDLQPVRSTNWDASLEYYFGRGGAASLAYFQRDVNGYIVTTTQNEEGLPNATGPVAVTKPINAGDGVIRGVEVNGSMFFDFAPGMLRNVGVSGNYTYTDSWQELPAASATANSFRGQTAGISKHSYNAALFYDDGTFRAKLAYSWRSDFTLAYNLANPANNLNWYPIERLAASATYRINRNISLTLDGTNLLGKPQRAYWGDKSVTDRVYFEGRVYSAALRFKF